MKIILQKDFDRLGNAHDVVEVKDGYGRNYLIPEGVAVLATAGNLRHNEEMKKYSTKKFEKESQAAKTQADKINGQQFTIMVRVKEGDDIYGSVSQQDIVELLESKGVELPRSAVLIGDPIKKLGVYDIAIKFFRDVEAVIKVWVVKKEEEQQVS
ncbi:MAG: 50S ribosomal protein L9 [Chitinispirillales bacterium]|jgi:large subunit ribosomal protein L9|nr:50S ribosomal protein L9 [Chitinispirillales bacterium]